MVGNCNWTLRLLPEGQEVFGKVCALPQTSTLKQDSNMSITSAEEHTHIYCINAQITRSFTHIY